MLNVIQYKIREIFIIGLLLSIGFCCVGTAAGSTVSVSPQISTAQVGDNFTIDIIVDPTGSEIYGAQFNLSFNENLLEATDLIQGTLLNQDGASTIVFSNYINNIFGFIDYGESRKMVQEGVTTSGILATIEFTVLAHGNCNLDLNIVEVGDPLSQPIPVYVYNGTFNNTEAEDLEISEITVKHNYYDGAWEDLINTVNVTIANTGADDAAIFIAVLYADDIEVNTITVPGLAAGTNAVVSFDWAPTQAKTYTLKAVAENTELTTSQEVQHNGYTGDKPLTTYTNGTLTGDIIFTHGNCSSSKELNPGDTYTASHTITLPDNAIIKSARLYSYWKWSHTETTGQYPTMSLSFDGSEISPDAQYDDRKGWGSFDYPSGTWAYNVTDLVTGSGSYISVVTNTDIGNGVFGINGLGLLVIFEDSTGQQIEYWINEGADMLSSKGSSGGLMPEEATTTSTFQGSVNTSRIESARLWTVVQSGDHPDNTLIFNAAEWTGVYDATPYADLDIDEARDVIDHLTASDNIAKISAATYPEGDYLMPSNAILVLAYTGVPSPKLSISADPTTVTVGVSTDVTFTVTNGSTPVEGADITLTGCADGSGTTDATGTATISVNATSAGTITATASKEDYVSDTTTLTAEEEGEGISSSVSIGANILPAIALEVTPGNVSFGELSPGETSDVRTLTLKNCGGLDFDITADVTDTANGLFKDGLLLSAEIWSNFSTSITAESSGTTEVSLAVPGDFVGVGSKEGTLVFWAQA